MEEELRQWAEKLEEELRELRDSISFGGHTGDGRAGAQEVEKGRRRKQTE